MTFIVAEIGINHNGSLDIAKKLIDIAVSSGCDAVKFQKRTVEKVYSKEVLDSPRESPWGKTTREQKLGLEFSIKDYQIIDRYCKKKKIQWYLSCWDIDSQIQMRKFKTKYNKVASAMLIHEKLLNTIAEEKKYTFISTGMSTMKEIEKAVKIFRKHKCEFELMHSHSSYPMKLNEANLRVIQTLKKKFKCNVGYSGHETAGYLVSVAAVLLGATSIERHITLDRTMYGSDQAASLEPPGLFRLVSDIRLLDQILGDGKKRIWDSELPAMKKLREILV
ncbi:MAG: N-acetylneuraminate synthase family protein [Nitrosopumilus sp.]|nr:N-acetylneuraminate synthase family protein [Nitrosopumilus sp.]